MTQKKRLWAGEHRLTDAQVRFLARLKAQREGCANGCEAVRLEADGFIALRSPEDEKTPWAYGYRATHKITAKGEDALARARAEGW